MHLYVYGSSTGRTSGIVGTIKYKLCPSHVCALLKGKDCFVAFSGASGCYSSVNYWKPSFEMQCPFSRSSFIISPSKRPAMNELCWTNPPTSYITFGSLTVARPRSHLEAVLSHPPLQQLLLFTLLHNALWKAQHSIEGTKQYCNLEFARISLHQKSDLSPRFNTK